MNDDAEKTFLEAPGVIARIPDMTFPLTFLSLEFVCACRHMCACAFEGDFVHLLAYRSYGSASYCATVCCFTFSFSSRHSMCVSWRMKKSVRR